jgi:hypothetical protein
VYASQISAQIVIVPDGKSGLKSAAYTILGCQEDGTLLEQPGEKGWTDCPGGRALELQEEGCYQIYVRTEDHVGNVAFAKSSIVCVDTTPPELTIEGAGDKSANSGTVRLTISSHDSHYKQGSMEVSVAGVNRGKSPVTVRQEESGDGAVIEYLDFPREQEYDDIYSVSVSAEDTAGNRAEKKLEFSVNRYGSVYDLSEETKQSLQEYYLSEAQPITFYETNIDYVGESRIYCRRDGDLQALKQGRDYEVTLQGEEDTWKQYQYTIPAEYFEKEGVYEVLLTSNDRASNSSDTKMQEKQVAFVLDWSEPKCTISGIAQRQVYETSALTACLTPHDNIGIRTMQVYLNSELLQETETPKENETVKVELQKSDAWQTLEVYVRDLAGNEYWSDEIPVYINTKTEQVPEYQKERSSARELAQGKLVSTRKSAAGNRRKTSTGTDRTADGTKLIKTESAGASKTEKAAASPSRKLEGLLILGIGFLMLIGTVISCLIGWGRRKK